MNKKLFRIVICFMLLFTVTACTKDKSFFAEQGYSNMMKVNQSYPYTTLCKDNPAITTTGKVTILRYEISQSYEGEEKAGYEWRIIEFEIVYDDENAVKNGMISRYVEADYFNGKLFFGEKLSINWQDKDYDIVKKWKNIKTAWENHVYTWNQIIAYQVPVGYDGMVIIFFSAANTNSNDGTYKLLDTSVITDFMEKDTLYFRLTNK